MPDDAYSIRETLQKMAVFLTRTLPLNYTQPLQGSSKLFYLPQNYKNPLNLYQFLRFFHIFVIRKALISIIKISGRPLIAPSLTFLKMGLVKISSYLVLFL